MGSATSIKGRFADYQTASPFRDYTLRFAAPFPCKVTAERAAKKRLRGWRVKGGEWFHVHYTDARAVIVKLQTEGP